MFNEDNTVEQMLIDAATKSGWQYVKSQEISRSADSVLVESWLLEALIRLNPITRQQAEQVIYKLRAAITCGGNFDELVTANDRFRTLLFNENTEPFGKDYGGKNEACQYVVGLKMGDCFGFQSVMVE